MNRLEVAENWAESQDASLLMLGGTPEERQSFADAFLGVMYMGDEDEEDNIIPVAIYSKEGVVKTFIERDGMSYEEAVEFFDFNVEGAYMGKGTPMYIETFDWELELENKLINQL